MNRGFSGAPMGRSRRFLSAHTRTRCDARHQCSRARRTRGGASSDRRECAGSGAAWDLARVSLSGPSRVGLWWVSRVASSRVASSRGYAAGTTDAEAITSSPASAFLPLATRPRPATRHQGGLRRVPHRRRRIRVRAVFREEGSPKSSTACAAPSAAFASTTPSCSAPLQALRRHRPKGDPIRRGQRLQPRPRSR